MLNIRLAWVLSLLSGCIFLSEDDLAQRLDRDGDGVLEQDDCDDGDPLVSEASHCFVDGDGDGFGSENREWSCGCEGGLSHKGGDCNDDDASLRETSIRYVDVDGDGFGADGQDPQEVCGGEGMAMVGGDCDDKNPEVHPQAEEVCDGIDNNCDRDVDEGVLRTWFPDRDGDRHGRQDAPGIESCAAPMEGYIDNSDDCDDWDSTVYEGAPQVGDDIDHDCDGFVDYDEDGDGRSSFLQGEGGSDCNDGDFYVQDPALDIAGDDWDNNCDGAIDRHRLISADAHVIGEEALDHAYAVSTGGDLNGDGYADLVVGAPGHGVWSEDGKQMLESAGAVYIVFGPITGDKDLEKVGVDGQGELPGVKIEGDGPDDDEDLVGDNYGAQVVSANFTTDQVGDLLVRSTMAEGACDGEVGCRAGSVELYYGPITGGEFLEADKTWEGDSVETGYTNAVYGDFDNDRWADLLLGRAGSRGKGEVEVVLGPYYEDGGEESNPTFHGAVEDDEIGDPHRLVLQDSNGDGQSDLWFGSPANATWGSDSGGVYFMEAPFEAAAFSVGEYGTLFTSKKKNHKIGERLAGAGDLDGDGVKDLAVYARTDKVGGTVYVILSSLVETPSKGEPLDIAYHSIRFDGRTPGDMFGAYMLGYPSGTAEADWLLVGARHAGDFGATYLFQGPLEQGVVSAVHADAVIPAESQASRPEEGVFPAVDGDIDHDGQPDFVLPARGEGGAGEVYLFLRANL